jgi:hypothetical protein
MIEALQQLEEEKISILYFMKKNKKR